MTISAATSRWRWLRRALLVLSVLVLLLLGLLLAAASYIAHSQNLDRRIVKPASGSYVQADDTQLFVQMRGDPNAAPVIFVHGTGAWSQIWSDSMDDVVRAGYRAVAIDLPPFGYSVPPASGRYDKGAQARRILGVLDSLHIDRAVFVVHSIGSAPLMEALLHRPERVGKLIMVCGALGLDRPQTDGGDSALQAVLRQRWIAEPLTAALFTNPVLTRTLINSFVAEKDKITPQWVATYQQPLTLSGSYQAIAQWIPELLARRGTWLSDDPQAYRKIGFPVTLIWGERDSITPISQALHLQQWIPNAQLTVIARAGHVPMIEEPALFHQALLAALAPVPHSAFPAAGAAPH